MKKHLVSKYGWHYGGVSLDPVSQTVPDQSLSVEEILRRFTSGTLMEGEINRQHDYGSDILPDEDLENLAPEYDPDYDLVDAFEAASTAESLRVKLNEVSITNKRQPQDSAPQVTSPQSPPQDSPEEPTK